jgi:uncharacterized protein
MTGDSVSAAKVAFLRRPSSHPERPGQIAVVETHFAWVFLGDRVVRKLKKPIRTEWLDFSSPERRRRACAAEVALNRPLAPDVYLRVEDLVLTDAGALALGRSGRAVDAVVVMRRLPAARALDRQAAWLDQRDLAPVAARLAAFYSSQAMGVDPAARLAQVMDSLANLQDRLMNGRLRHHGHLMACLFHFARSQAPRLGARAVEGRVVDAHGDLRPEHVYLTAPPRILDRLEFGSALRLIDWLEDMALLAVDLERQGRAWIGDRLMRAVAHGLCDEPPHDLWCFYRGWRALLRAQLALEHLDRANGEPEPAMRFHWLLRARACLAIARRHTARLNGRAGR